MSTPTTSFKPIRFSSKIGKDFNSTLKKRVRAFFKDNNISKYGNVSMYLKSVFMLSLYFVPIILLYSGQLSSFKAILLMYILMGFGAAGIGLSVMHDANHGAYSKNQYVNKYLGKIANAIGGFATNWKIQHNVLHHSYTNIAGYDEDISSIKILRFTPDEQLRPIHKFQFIYAWFFYGLMTFLWLTTKDFNQIFRYKKMNLTKMENDNFGAIFAELIISKIIYYMIIIILPMVLLPIAWYWILLFVFIMHFITGFIFGIIFQTAHVMPGNKYIAPNDSFKIENNFTIHQMETTANYSPKSTVFSWLIGGLNYQVEHHLFPDICHVHYKKISHIVKETAAEFGVPYNSQKTFLKALYNHTVMLKNLGRE